MAVESEANVFQKYLIPSESRYVRYCMQKAGIYGNRPNFFYSHIVSVAFAIAAVVMSFFNALSYFVRIPLSILLNIVQFEPIGVVIGLINDCTNVIRSLVFVALGVWFIVAGLLFPKPIFFYFAPEYCDSLETRLMDEVSVLKERISWLENEFHAKQEELDGAHKLIDDQKKTIESFKSQKSGRKKFFFGLC